MDCVCPKNRYYVTMKIYKFTLKDDFLYTKPLLKPFLNYFYRYSFLDKNGIKWLELINENNYQTIKILKGYSWDGCSPKLKMGGKIIGVWDGPVLQDGYPACYKASLVHDALCQFWDPNGPYSLIFADKNFQELLDSVHFKYSKLYYNMVRHYHLVRYGE